MAAIRSPDAVATCADGQDGSGKLKRVLQPKGLELHICGPGYIWLDGLHGCHHPKGTDDADGPAERTAEGGRMDYSEE